MIQVYNPSDSEIKVEKGERIGQASFVRVDRPEVIEVESMAKKDRGGFGSTGSHV